MFEIIILGGGPSGLTAAIYAVRAGHRTLLVAGSKWGGQLMLTTLVENFPGFKDGIMGPELMMNMRAQAERLGVKIINSDFSEVNFKNPFNVVAGGEIYEGKSLILATGADSIWLDVPGEKELRGKGVSSCATCDAFFFRGKNVIVVGGGDAAMEEAHYIANVANSVTIVHRREEFRASKAMQDKVFANPKIKVIWNSSILRYNGSMKLDTVNLKVSSVKGKIPITAGKEKSFIACNDAIKKFGGKQVDCRGEDIVWEYPVDGVFVAIGHKPNTGMFKGIELDKKGYVVRKETKNEEGLLEYFTATSVPGVFTAGDVHDYRYRQAITASAYGCMAALDADRWLSQSSK